MTARAGGARRGNRLQVAVLGATPTIAARGLGPWLAANAPARARGEVTVKLVSDREMARLNGSFRHKLHATDVLSFPVERPGAGGPALLGSNSRGQSYLGDIAVARGVARRQARAERHPVGTELRILALHGLLHLLGYDHERDQGQMLRTEERLRRRAGLPAGLVTRHSKPPRTRTR